MLQDGSKHTLFFNYSLKKEEILRGEKNIQLLFKSKNSFFSFPFKVLFQKIENTVEPNKVLFSVPKKIFKKAVDRNKIKRQIKEAYRKQKGSFSSKNNNSFIFTLMYLHTDFVAYEELEKRMKIALTKLNQV